jgi:hypothetical protein
VALHNREVVMYYAKEVNYRLMCESGAVEAFRCTDAKHNVYQMTAISKQGAVMAAGKVSLGDRTITKAIQDFAKNAFNLSSFDEAFRVVRHTREDGENDFTLLYEGGIVLDVDGVQVRWVEVVLNDDENNYAYITPGLSSTPDGSRLRQLQLDKGASGYFSEPFTPQAMTAACEQDAKTRW